MSSAACVQSVSYAYPSQTGMVRPRRSRSQCARQPMRHVNKVRRSRSRSKILPVVIFTTLLELLCDVFHCPPQDLDAPLWTQSYFVLRLLQNIYSQKDLIVSGIPGQKFFGLRWTILRSSWLRLQHPTLPTVLLSHQTSTGLSHVSSVPIEHIHLSKLLKC